MRTISILLSVLLIAVVVSGMPDTVVVKKSNTFITQEDKGIKPVADKMAAAQMSHKKHASATVKCDQCHHAIQKQAAKEMVCAKCHKGAEGSKIVMSNSCMKCHKEMKKGPLKCKECHTVALAPQKNRN